MFFYLLQSLVIAFASCVQISFYTPFRNRAGKVIFFAVMTAGTYGTIFLYDHYGGTVFSTLGCIIFAAAASAAALKVCKTALYCGIYNVLIQICVNDIAFCFAHKAAGWAGLGSAGTKIMTAAILLIIEGAWCFIMYRNRQVLWLHMPQPDEYYFGVMVFIFLDYLILLFSQHLTGTAAMVLVSISLAMLILILYTIWLPQQIIEEKHRSEMLHYQQKAMQNYTDWYLQHEESMRTLRHDIRHVLNATQELIKQNETGKIGALTESVRRNLDRISVPDYCDNVLINAILQDYTSQFERSGIPFTATVRIPEPICISELDITTLLHNILSNAIEYLVSTSDPSAGEASIRIFTVRNHFGIICENTLENEILIRDGKISSSKADDRHVHGIGLESIRHTARKYTGEVVTTAENGRFVLKVMLVNRAVSTDH